MSLSSSRAAEREARVDQERALALLAEPGTARIPLVGADGVLVVSRTGDAALVVSNLDPAPEGKAYEAWVIENGQPRPAGLFDAGKGRTVVALERSVPADALFAVTVEDEQGAERPSGRPLFTAEPA